MLYRRRSHINQDILSDPNARPFAQITTLPTTQIQNTELLLLGERSQPWLGCIQLDERALHPVVKAAQLTYVRVSTRRLITVWSAPPPSTNGIRQTLALVGAAWIAYRLYHVLMSSSTSIPASTTEQGIRSLVKQTARWTLAAGQDQNPMVAMLHANYGVGYWSALRSLATLETIERAARINATELERWVLNAQASAAAQLFRRCPNVKPRHTALARIAHGIL